MKSVTFPMPVGDKLTEGATLSPQNGLPTEAPSNTNYENEDKKDLPVLSLHSMESVDSVTKPFAAGFARRLTLGTLKGLGVSKETNFDKVKMMQRARAKSIAGQTKETQKVDSLLGKLQEALKSDDEETTPIDVKLKDADVMVFNQAFRRDVEGFMPELAADEAQKGASDASAGPVIDRSLRMSADIDEIALASLNKPPTPLADKKRKKSWRKAAQLDHLYKFKKMSVVGRSLQVISNLAVKGMPPVQVPKLHVDQRGISSLEEWERARRLTLYENYYTDQQVSEAGLYLHRFRSAHQSPSSIAQWDGDEYDIVSEELHASKVRKEGTKALKSFQSKGYTKASIKEDGMTDVGNPTFSNVVAPGDGHVGGKEGSLMEEPAFYRSPPLDESKDNFLYGNDALEHYMRYISIEKEINAERLNEEKFHDRLQLDEKRSKIMEALSLAKDYYCSDHGIAAKLRRRMTVVKDKVVNRQSIDTGNYKAHTGIRLQLESLRTYVPWFIIAMTLLQAITVLFVIGLGGVAPIGFMEQQKMVEHETWGGDEYVTKVVSTNPWIGPTKLTLVQLGALFVPCIRLDYIISRRIGQYEQNIMMGFGCCEVPGAGAGTTTSKECESISITYDIPNYLWINTTCNNRDLKSIGKSFESHKFKPCCYGFIGQCILATNTHCRFLDGLWHSDMRENCAQVHCGRDVCSTSHIHSVNAELEPHFAVFSNQTEKLDIHTHFQYWRLFISIFYHHGLIHFTLVAALQCIMGLDVEKVAGWLRIAAIYCVSGYGGLLCGSLVKPYEPNVGAEGAAFGLLGMNFVELIQAWSLVDHPHKALFKLIFITTVALTSGFVPQMNLFSQLSGFWLGTLMSIICLPYVTFNRWHSGARRVIVTISLSLVLITLVTCIFLLHTVQPAGIGSRNSYKCILDNICDSSPTILDGL